MTCRTCTVMLLLLLTALPNAQEIAGGAVVRGVVRDEGGGMLVGASIVLTDSDGRRTTAVSDKQGRYQLALSPRTTSLGVQMPGFAPFTRQIPATPTGVVTIDVVLRVATTTRVDVHGGLTGVSLESGQNMASITLSGSTLDFLPGDPEGLLQTLRLLAGTTGTRLDQVAFYVDGAPIDRRLPPKDIIQTIRINANPFSAEFSEPGPSRVEIITKPASGEYHGDARFDFNDAVLNARNVFEPTKPRVQLRTYTGYVGGPVVKDHFGVLVYGARWDLDENSLVDATTLDRVTLLPQTLRLNVAAPTRTTSYSVKGDALLTKQHILVLEYAQDNQQAHNAGLQSGFDLPERAYASTSREQTGSLRLTSTLSNRLLNEFYVRTSHRETLDNADSGAPAILVLENFNGGGNQDAQYRSNVSNEVLVTNVSTFAGKDHSVRVGLQAQTARLSQTDYQNYNGTFTFGTDFLRNNLGSPILDARGEPIVISALELYRQTILGIPGARPSVFMIVWGNPSITVPVVAGAGFFQDDWRVSPRLTLSYGARGEFQRELTTHTAVAPRAGIAWAPSAHGRSALRAGAGLFYSRIPQAITADVSRSRQNELLAVSRPDFFPNVPTELPSAETVVMTRTEAPNFSFPLTFLSTVSFDQQIGPHLFSSVGYTWRRGIDLLRTRVINGMAGLPGGETFGPILQFESTGASTAHEFHVTASGTVGASVSLFGSYEWTRAFQDTDGPYTIPADSSTLASEWGMAPVPRHQAALGASFNLPNHLSIGTFVKVSSKLPFNITTGRDNNGDLQFTDRPAPADPSSAGAIVTPYGAFNPNPAAGSIIIPRNSGAGPTEFTLNLTASWSTWPALTFGDRGTFTIAVNNLTNRISYAPYIGVLTSPFFGAANRALEPRRVTLSLRYNF
jgi:carboxypeptidase family protein